MYRKTAIGGEDVYIYGPGGERYDFRLYWTNGTLAITMRNWNNLYFLGRQIWMGLEDQGITQDRLGTTVPSALESGWGNGRFAKEGNNFFSLQMPASLAIGSIPALGNPKVKVAKFGSYADSAESFALDYGSIVRNITNPAKLAAALQNAGKYGINPDGSKVPTFVGDTAGTIRGLAKRLDCE